LLRAALLLAAASLLFGWVSPAEVPALLDLDLLFLFFVLIVAVESARRSGLFARLVRAVLTHSQSSRGLAIVAVLLTGAAAALVTNDVALLLVVPFTLSFEAASRDFDAAPVIVLEITAANLIGCLTPTGNPQNLFLFVRGRFTAGGFFMAQGPWVFGAGLLTLAAVPLLVRKRTLAPPKGPAIAVEPKMAAAAVVLFVLEMAALFAGLPRFVPALAALLALGLLGARALEVDFALVGLFAALFVGVAGLSRSPLAYLLDPTAFLGVSAAGLAASGALLSQFVSNVPAALLLAPHAAASPDPLAFAGLLYGVNAGGCGTPIASIANLIGARLYLSGHRELVGRVRAGRFWRLFSAVSFALLVATVALSLFLLARDPGGQGLQSSP
jgi:Na+/H+ antiporter NhaD/arsenite permease-like protein